MKGRIWLQSVNTIRARQYHVAEFSGYLQCSFLFLVQHGMFCVSLPIRLIVSFVFPISVIIYYSYQAYINWENQNLDWVGVHS